MLSPPSIGVPCSGENDITTNRKIIPRQQPLSSFARDDYLGAVIYLYTLLGTPETPRANTNVLAQRMKCSRLTSEGKYILFSLQYCPIPAISYPQLENELFCNIFYLRHLCDTDRFPDWEIREPVRSNQSEFLFLTEACNMFLCAISLCVFSLKPFSLTVLAVFNS